MSALTVAELLSEAHVAHEDYRHALQPLSYDPASALTALRRAYSARANAEMLDPAMTDPAWGADLSLIAHYALLAFYLQHGAA